MLPEGFSINLQLVNHQTRDTLKEALIGRGDYVTKERVIPGAHAWDGSYTELVVECLGISIRVQSAVVNNELFMLVSPTRHSPADTLLLDPQMLWKRTGEIRIKDNRILAGTIHGTTVLTIAPGQYKVTEKYIKFLLAQPITITSGTSLPEKEIMEIIKNAGAKLAARKSGYPKTPEEYDASEYHISIKGSDNVAGLVNKILTINQLPEVGFVLFNFDKTNSICNDKSVSICI